MAISRGAFLDRAQLSAMMAQARMRVINMSRYPGLLVIDILIPIIFAALPIMLGQASDGGTGSAAANFQANTGTADFKPYLLIGASSFALVTRAFWDIAYWVRFEQETGTLEAIYLTPTSSLTMAAGVAVYSAVRGLATMFIAYFAGALLFRVDPWQGELVLALSFVLVGLIPLYSVAFLFGALILKVKEANALVALMQWVVTFLMGVLFPVTVLPPVIRVIAWAFPPTWMVNGVRSALLGVDYFFRVWYLDFAVLWVFLLVTPLLSVWAFRHVEASIQRNQGVGEF